MPPRQPSILRIFLIRFIPLSLLWALLAMLVYSVEQNADQKIIHTEETSHVHAAFRDIERVTKRITSDLLYLSATASLHNYLGDGKQEDFDEIIEDYITFSRVKRVYDQIRFLDTSGQEIIRIDYRPDGPIVVPKNQLQNKADRYYFSDTIKLAKGQIYLSPLDLNIEHNTIEIPHKPMLRVATPVFDRQHRLKGIVIINYHADELLKRIADNDNHEIAGHLSLLNSNGFWLRSPDPDKTWGFMLNRPDLTLAVQAPAAWQKMQSAPKGQFTDEQGFWVYAKVYPLAGLQQLTPSAADYHWILVAHIPNQQLQMQRNNLISTVLFLFALTLLLTGVGVWATATARYHQKRLELDAHEQLNQLHMLMDSTLEGIYGVDLNGYCTLANLSCARMLKYDSPQSMLGKHMHSLIHHSYPNGSPYPAVECKAHRAIETGTDATIEDEVFWCADGSALPVAYTSRPIKYDGAIIGMVCSFVDISERAQHEQEKARLLTVLEESLNEIYLFNTETLRFEYANRAALQNLGYSMAEMSELTAFAIKPNITESTFRQMIQPLFDGNQANLEFQTTHQRKDGSSYPVEVHLQLIWAGDHASFLAIIFDITDRQAMENQLRHAQKMEAIGQLASGVAHDFNNILQVISGNAQLIQMRACKECPSLNQEADILRAVERGVNLTRSMLAFARRQNLTLTPQELNQLVQESELLAHKLLGPQHQLTRILHDKPLKIAADATLLQQIIFNLVTNARDAMPEGGTITIGTGQVDLDSDFIEQHGFGTVGPHAMLWVSDTGQGISEELRAKIFDPFFTTKGVGKGTGLGLAMVYGTVKQHNGCIVLDSKPGSGSTFSIYLPLQNQAQTERQTREPLHLYADLFGAGQTLLLVEDEDGTRNHLAAFIQRCGYQVVTAATGQEACEHIRQNPSIQLAILDLVMPGMDGVETLQLLLTERPDLLSVFLSAHGAELLKLRNITNHCLSKPVDMKELLTTIRHLLQSNKSLTKESP